MNESTLFPLPDADPETRSQAPKKREKPRVRSADRRQLRLVPTNLDALLPEDHQARSVWAYVERLDLSALYAAIAAVEGRAGRPATDPRILLSLWVFATIEGVGSARALDRLCEEHVAFRWICGGVTMNHTTLAEFRTANLKGLQGARRDDRVRQRDRSEERADPVQRSRAQGREVRRAPLRDRPQRGASDHPPGLKQARPGATKVFSGRPEAPLQASLCLLESPFGRPRATPASRRIRAG